MKRTILFLDLATKTGWSLGSPGERVTHGSLRFASPKEDQAVAFFRFGVWLDGMIDNRGVTNLVYEQPMDPRHMKDKRTGRATTNFSTIRLLLGLCAITEARATAAGISVNEASVNSIRSFILSGSRAPKGQAKLAVTNRLKMLGYYPEDGDAADAVAGWLYASALLEPGKDIATPLPLGRG